MNRTFKAIEDNAGGLHLFIFDDGKCIYAGGGYSEILGSLFEEVNNLRKREVFDYSDYDPEEQGRFWSEMEADMAKNPHGYKLVADEKQDYPDRMGVAATLDWVKEGGKVNLLAAAIAAPTIDEAIKPIQDALGITSGDVAGEYFSPYADAAVWGKLPTHDRVLLIAGWLKDEVWSASP